MNVKKVQLKSLAQWLVIGVLGGLSILAVVKAASSLKGLVIENCNDCNFVVQGSEEGEVAGMLGASGTRFPNGISADSTSPSAGEVRGTTLTITGLATLSGGLLNPEFTSTVLSTSTDSETTGVLTQSDLSSYDYFEIAIGSPSGMFYTMPASSTLTSVLDTAGDRQEWIFRNTTTTAGVDLSFGAGVGTYLEYTSTTPRVFASSTASIVCVKAANTDVNCMVHTGAN